MNSSIERRAFLKRISSIVAIALVSAVAIFPMLGCPGQNETAALITIVGQSVATLANIQGNPVLAQQLADASVAATTAVRNWKQGDSSQNVIQALNLLTSNINLIPVSDQTKIFISLAVTTVNSIIAIVSPAPTGLTAPRATKPLVTAKEYRKQWNSLTAAHPSKVPAI